MLTYRVPSWHSQRTPVTSRPFTGQVGPFCPLPACILRIFKLLFTANLMEMIVEQTNLYDKQVMWNTAYECWKPVIHQELWAYLGFSILVSINYLPSLADYWRSDEIHHYSPVAGHIRYFEISRYLHFVNNSTR